MDIATAVLLSGTLSSALTATGVVMSTPRKARVTALEGEVEELKRDRKQDREDLAKEREDHRQTREDLRLSQDELTKAYAVVHELRTALEGAHSQILQLRADLAAANVELEAFRRRSETIHNTTD